MSISRRRFLKWFGAANLAVLPGKTTVASTNHHFAGYPSSQGVLFDATLCIGCRQCEKACNEVNEFPPPEIPFDDLSVLNQMRRTGNTTYTVVNQYPSPSNPEKPIFRKTQCNHCLEPACAAVCFVKAFKKAPSGAVVYDASVCVGCRYCMVACPFEIPTYEYNDAFSPKVQKCTLCQPRITNGLQPGCVDACPTEALVFGKRSDLLHTARQRIESKPGRYVDHIYGDREMGGTSWLYLSGVPFKEIGLKEDLGVKPALEFTAGAISAVPIVIGLWPVFLLGAFGMSKRIDKNAKEDSKAAVDLALRQAQEIADTKLADALARAEKTKKKEIENAVKMALADTAEKGEKTQKT